MFKDTPLFDKPPPIVALFNYGGGLRGIIQAQIMSHIEQDTGLRMAEMVDVFAGPSTGAILNAALNLRNPENPSVPKYRARHLVRFYEREGERIFPASRFREFKGLINDLNNRTMRISQLNTILGQGHYNPANLGRALRTLYGDARLDHSLKSLIIPTYNIDGEQLRIVSETGEVGGPTIHTRNNFMDTAGHALWLKNIKINGMVGYKHKTPDVALYDAVMASTAAPTYFPCHHFKARWPGHTHHHEYAAIDGSIFDSPSTTYFGALQPHLLPGQEVVMLALGTGFTNRSIKKDEWNKYGSLGVVDPANDLPLINIFFHATESALLDVFEEKMNGNLFLFNKSLVSGRQSDWPSVQIDDGSPGNMKKLKDFANSIIEDNRSRYEEMCALLVRHHDEKKNWIKMITPSRWEKIFSFMTK